MDYTVTYFFLIPDTERRTRAISELLTVSLVSSYVKFCTALPVLYGSNDNINTIFRCVLQSFVLLPTMT